MLSGGCKGGGKRVGDSGAPCEVPSVVGKACSPADPWLGQLEGCALYPTHGRPGWNPAAPCSKGPCLDMRWHWPGGASLLTGSKDHMWAWWSDAAQVSLRMLPPSCKGS